MSKKPQTQTSVDDNEMREALQGLRADTPSPAPGVSRPPTKRGPKPKPKEKEEPRAVGALPAPQASTEPNRGAADYSIYNIKEVSVNEEDIEPIDIKDELSEKERKFVLLHLMAGVRVKDALILAGYREYEDHYASTIGRKIVKKYERQADGREIFSDLNFGPAEIARGIMHIAIHAPNLQIRLNALALAAKATGLLKEAIDQAPGVTIVIKGRGSDSDAQAGGREPEPYRPNNPAVAVQVNGPVALTR
jgi:hypothetical protein